MARGCGSKPSNENPSVVYNSRAHTSTNVIEQCDIELNPLDFVEGNLLRAEETCVLRPRRPVIARQRGLHEGCTNISVNTDARRKIMYAPRGAIEVINYLRCEQECEM